MVHNGVKAIGLAAELYSDRTIDAMTEFPIEQPTQLQPSDQEVATESCWGRATFSLAKDSYSRADENLFKKPSTSEDVLYDVEALQGCSPSMLAPHAPVPGGQSCARVIVRHLRVSVVGCASYAES